MVYYVFGAMVQKSIEVVSSIKGTLMVQEFSNIFSNSLLRLASDRELEFSIMLALNITPIFKAPYRITTMNYKN